MQKQQEKQISFWKAVPRHWFLVIKPWNMIQTVEWKKSTHNHYVFTEWASLTSPIMNTTTDIEKLDYKSFIIKQMQICYK